MNEKNFSTDIPVKVLDKDGDLHKGILHIDFNYNGQKMVINSKVQSSINHDFPDSRVVYDFNIWFGSLQDRTTSRNPGVYMAKLETLAASFVSNFENGTYANVSANERITDKMIIEDKEKTLITAKLAEVVDKLSDFTPVINLHHVDKYGDEYVGILNVNGVDMDISVFDNKIKIDQNPNSVPFKVVKNHSAEVLEEVRNSLNEYEQKMSRTKPRSFDEYAVR